MVHHALSCINSSRSHPPAYSASTSLPIFVNNLSFSCIRPLALAVPLPRILFPQVSSSLPLSPLWRILSSKTYLHVPLNSAISSYLPHFWLPRSASAPSNILHNLLIFLVTWCIVRLLVWECKFFVGGIFVYSPIANIASPSNIDWYIVGSQ